MFRRLFILLFIASLFGNAWALTEIEAQGSAAIKDGAVNMAREQAIKDAMRQAATQAKSEVDSTMLTSANVLTIESTRVNAAGRVENVRVLKEWIDEKVFYVRIRANVPEKGARRASPAARYRKKVAVLQFDVQDRSQILDLPGIEQQWPRELLRRLEQSGDFLGVDGTTYLVSKTSPGYKFDNPESYAHLAEKLDAQIIVSGIIRSLVKRKGWVYDQRDIDVELFIHDGLSGARIANYRFTETVEKFSIVSVTGKWLRNESFLSSSFGKTMDTILERNVEVVRDNLQRIPFTARIVEINGNEIVFNAGTSSLVGVGDVLMTYRLSADPLRYGDQNFYLGRRETPIATMAVEQVQPLFAVGKLEIDKAQLFPGDIIRFGR